MDLFVIQNKLTVGTHCCSHEELVTPLCHMTQCRTEGQAGGSWDWPLPPAPTRTPSTPGLSQPGTAPAPSHGTEGTARPWNTTLSAAPPAPATKWDLWATVLSYREGKRQQERLLWPVVGECQSSSPAAPSPSCLH